MRKNASLPDLPVYTKAAIGLRLKALRRVLKLPQAIIADACSLEAFTWNAAERGKANLSWPYATLIADATGCSLDYIFRNRYDGMKPKLVKALRRELQALQSNGACDDDEPHSKQQLQMLRRRREAMKLSQKKWRTKMGPIRFRY